ncbi:MAG: type II toxin-antitoxin system CcdA family antitoxin, partial [Archaeoglobaceae archaeon]|nr:type II toxin-antitoxin system CcdA family antitoxin [Archaeoglobaceae archaeon]MDW8119015.1 type II toxin-antitoxin system CcdA family antitoxin [Archaeoglobaceae archaeon]
MKKRTSVYVDTKLLELAKQNGLNLSKLLESILEAIKNRKSDKTEDLRPCPVGVRGFESRPPHRSELESKLDDFIFKLKLSHISEQEIKAYSR